MDYLTLCQKAEKYKSFYGVYSIGKSLFGREIFAVETPSSGFSTAFLVAGVHAREHITTDLVCRMLDDRLFEGLPFKVTVIPMLNPDGVELCSKGLVSLPFEEIGRVFEINKKNFDFSMWKANGRGVDLNNNFDANFGQNIGSSEYSASGYPGKNPESEAESKALADFTRKTLPFITISYHSKGEEIYFNFFQEGSLLERDKMIADCFSKSTGYAIKNPESVSSGGYKDFCVQKMKIPALTIEIGSDLLTHPIQPESLPEIYKRHNFIAKDLLFAYNTIKKFDRVDSYGLL